MHEVWPIAEDTRTKPSSLNPESEGIEAYCYVSGFTGNLSLKPASPNPMPPNPKPFGLVAFWVERV